MFLKRLFVVIYITAILLSGESKELFGTLCKFISCTSVLVCSAIVLHRVATRAGFYVQWESKTRLKITSSKTSSVNMINHDLLSFDLYAMAAYI